MTLDLDRLEAEWKAIDDEASDVAAAAMIECFTDYLYNQIPALIAAARERDAARANADRLAEDLRNAEANGFDSGSGALAAHDAEVAER